MPEDRTSRGEVALWCLAAVMALVLFLLAPQLSAGNNGSFLSYYLVTNR